MLKKKLITLLTVFAILAVSVCGSFLTLPKVSAANLIYDDFESGLNGWGPRGP
jgi:endo-1,4-beta-xylanase